MCTKTASQILCSRECHDLSVLQGILAEDHPPAKRLFLALFIMHSNLPSRPTPIGSKPLPQTLLVVDELHHNGPVLQLGISDRNVKHFDEVLAHADKLEVRAFFAFEGSSLEPLVDTRDRIVE
jgi:hypothetical protein